MAWRLRSVRGFWSNFSAGGGENRGLASRPPTHSSCPPSRPFVAPAGCCLSRTINKRTWGRGLERPGDGVAASFFEGDDGNPSSHWCRHRYCASIFANRRHRHCRHPLPPSNEKKRQHPHGKYRENTKEIIPKYRGGVLFLFHRKIHRSNRHLSQIITIFYVCRV